MRKLVALLFALVALLVQLRAANACGNAVLADEDSHRKLSAANDALDEGDVVQARALAAEVERTTTEEGVRRHAKRTIALSWIRDRRASPEDIARETHVLGNIAGVSENADPSVLAELGEAYARGGQDEAAYRTLSSLANRDLMGSPHAYAALARVAEKRGDHGMAVLAKKRCAEITSDASVCRGEYPSPPLLRGHVLGYGVPGVIALLAFARRRRAKHPWSTYGDRVLAAIVVATCAFVLVYARSPWTTTLVTFGVIVAVGILQRVAFLSAVKRERIAGFVLREPAAGDEQLPAVASFFHSMPRVLEHVPDATYREPARIGVLRLTPRRRAPLVLAVVGFSVLALLGTCSLLTARSVKSASVSER
jgi:hypothetical protein